MLSSGNGRHRRPRPTPQAVLTVATAAATGAGIAIPLLGATTAQAAEGSTWDRVAACETGGLWSANTGNGFYGGLAITQDTWDQHGGDAYASRPDLASRAQQITVAERILADLGPGAWPGCDTTTGLAKDHKKPDVDPGDPSSGPSLPGMPLPAIPGVPLPAMPGVPLPTATVPSDSGTPTGMPSWSTSPSTGAGQSTDPGDHGDQDGQGDSGSQDGTPGSTGTGGSNTDPGTGVTTAQPSAGTPSDSGAPSAAAPGGRHAKPYSPTDEELAAADRASRTEIYSSTGKDASDVPGVSDTDTTGNANKADKSGTSDVSRYTVDLGDSLASIARGHHVDGGWRALYDANHHVIGDDPNLIKPGQILNLG